MLEIFTQFVEDQITTRLVLSGHSRFFSPGRHYIQYNLGRYVDLLSPDRHFGNSARCFLQDKLTPAAFEKHSGRETARKWKNNIWLMYTRLEVNALKQNCIYEYDHLKRDSNIINIS
ncbi:hypothetical protein G4B88_009835 [Cannabis sativa]|uniref:ULTRAPETALA1/2 SAND domain-containing protein n=1 Tax=Cannabis sativa TaxID=3483 RepID=A0A7J6HTY6_CANSA|nr:hypothetical protein G4B88_009835 [Cannabis sativa]